MSDDRARYLARGSPEKAADHARLDMIRAILAEEATWAEAPPEVGDAILGVIGRERRPMSERVGHRTSLWHWAAAIAAAGFAVVALVIGLAGETNGQRDEVVVAMEGTDLQTNAVGQATLRPRGSGWWIRLELTDLPAAPDGTYYEGWVWSDEGDGVSIGTFHLRGEPDPVILWSGVEPADYPSIWVTLEDEDGDASASDRIVMWGRIGSSE